MSEERGLSPVVAGEDSATPKVRITVVNDFPVVVAGLAAVLSRYAELFEVVRAAAGTVPLPPSDLVLYDVFARSGSIEELVERTQAKVVVFTQVLDPQAVIDALRAGVAGYIYKGVSITQLVAALLDIHRGSAPVVDVKPDPGLRTASELWPGKNHDLSQREAEIIALICRGQNNQQIAAQTRLSINSVKTHIRLAYRKMGVDSRTKAVVWGMRHGFASSPSSIE